MLIISWNVAGFSKTVQRIDQNYGNSTVRKRSPSTVIGEYMRRHHADIFCIQESKIPIQQLESRNEPYQCAHVEGYESFWSCCIDSSKRGFNGVTTYCKKGLVCRANSRPLECAELDDQGRCVMTDHGSFVLFNVYVPAGGGQPLAYKMKFLNALRNAMKKQREQHNKQVILVGDLNVSHTKKDMFWGSRRLRVNDICAEVQQQATVITAQQDDVPKWKLDLAKTWPKIEEILKTKKVVRVQTTNPRTKAKFEKYRMTVQMNNEKEIFLGSHEDNPGHCEYDFDFTAAYYTCADTDEQILAEEENVICISTVAELMGKLGGIEWDVDLQKQIAETDGTMCSASPPRRWLNDIINEDGMIDAFRYFYPNAEGRFTIWDQFRNRRYENHGARIDYTLIDSSLLPYLKKVDVSSLRCACAGKHDPDSEQAALCAATANGRFQAVSFEGGGIIEASQDALDTQFGPPYTGHVYTPPSFSDHIAVSLLLDELCCPKDLELDQNEKKTRIAQPHKKVRPISSYFGTAAFKKNNVKKDTKEVTLSTTSIQGHPAKTLPQKRKGPMHGFLTKKNESSFDNSKNSDHELSSKKQTNKGLLSSSSSSTRPLKGKQGKSKKGETQYGSIKSFFQT